MPSSYCLPGRAHRKLLDKPSSPLARRLDYRLMHKANGLMAMPVAVLLFLGGCNSERHNPSETYILVTANTKVPYWQSAVAGLREASRELKVKTELMGPATYDIRSEHDEFLKAVESKPAGILISASDANIFAPDIDAAEAQGVPVITIDSDAPTSKRLVFVGTDNYNAGMLGGQLLVKLLNDRGNVAVFTMPNQSNLSERLHGYQGAIEGHPGIKITRVIDIRGDPMVALDNAKELLNNKANKIDAFVCLEAISCPEAGEVARRTPGADKLIIIAMDTDQRTLALIQKGVISATIAQKPWTMAYFGVKLLDEVHHDPPKSLTADFAQDSYAPLPTFVDTGTFIVDKDNVAKFIEEAQSHDAQ